MERSLRFLIPLVITLKQSTNIHNAPVYVPILIKIILLHLPVPIPFSHDFTDMYSLSLFILNCECPVDTAEVFSPITFLFLGNPVFLLSLSVFPRPKLPFAPWHTSRKNSAWGTSHPSLGANKALAFMSLRLWGTFPHLGWLPIPPGAPHWLVFVPWTLPVWHTGDSPWASWVVSHAAGSPFLLSYLAIFLEPSKLERVSLFDLSALPYISRTCSFESRPAINVLNSNPDSAIANSACFLVCKMGMLMTYPITRCEDEMRWHMRGSHNAWHVVGTQ